RLRRRAARRASPSASPAAAMLARLRAVTRRRAARSSTPASSRPTNRVPRGPVMGPSGPASVSLRLILIALALARALGGGGCEHGAASQRHRCRPTGSPRADDAERPRAAVRGGRRTRTRWGAHLPVRDHEAPRRRDSYRGRDRDLPLLERDPEQGVPDPLVSARGPAGWTEGASARVS